MKVSLDGGVTYTDAPDGVRVIYDDLDVLDVDGEEGTGELHVNLTDEGLILDVWLCHENGTVATSMDTSSETVDELVAELVEDNA